MLRMNTAHEIRSEADWRERQKHELKALIYRTALELFQAEGYEETTIQQIASQARIGKGTFFNHFTSKDHVLQEWYRRITQQALAHVAGQKYGSGCAAILALSAELTKGAAENPSLWCAKCASTSSRLLRQEEDDLDKEVHAFCRLQIERDFISGQLAPSSDANFLADMVLTVLTGVGHNWTVAQQKWDLVDTTKARVAFVLEAARSPKGDR